MNMIATVFFTPECAYSRQQAPTEGHGCFRVIINLPGEQATFKDYWLEPHEMHCPYDPQWRAEQVEIVWKELGRSVFPDELMIVERCSKQRAEAEKWRSEEGTS